MQKCTINNQHNGTATSYARNMKNTRTGCLEPETEKLTLQLRNWDHADCTRWYRTGKCVSTQIETVLLPFKFGVSSHARFDGHRVPGPCPTRLAAPPG